jgi:hypothetical protein
MPKMTKSLSTFAAVGVLALGVTACGSNNDSSSTGSNSSSSNVAATPTPVASIPDLSNGVSTKVKLDSGFVAALTSLKVTPAPVGTATISKAGVATFPITGGNVQYYTPGTHSPYVTGLIEHNGSGLSLTAGSTKVSLTNFEVNPGTSTLTGKVSVNGKVAAASAPLFFLNGKTLQALKTGANNTAILTGTTVELKQEAADLLNKTFKISALKAGLVIGVATITVKTA